MFTLETTYTPCGDQPEAIQALSAGILRGERHQVLLGVTGSGKTFTMANVIAAVSKPTLIIAHNKTLAAQLYQEFRGFFPKNAVEYFVSYYDYYQPEAYIPRTDTYIEKDAAINDRIDTMRLSATRSLLERQDVIIVSSVSCIYGLGLPEYYRKMNLHVEVGEERKRDEVLMQLVDMQYTRTETELTRATFRSRGDILEIFPAYEEAVAIRIEFFDTTIEGIYLFDPVTKGKISSQHAVTIYAGSHHVTPEEARERAVVSIRRELEERHQYLQSINKFIEAQRLFERVTYDIEMIKEVGFCSGIENYSRHFGDRKQGEPPACLLDYFPKDFLCVIDESHQTVPQLGAMYQGDRSRKEALIEYGFRLPSAFDNRPLKFDELCVKMNQTVYVSATPAAWEVQKAGGCIVEQVLRPTGLLDPVIEIRSARTQVENCLGEIRKEKDEGGKVLVTTLTKKLAEELTTYLTELGVKAKYLHADVAVLERIRIVHELRMGEFDVLVGINLLREGLDIPEVSLVVVLDADREGFLRSETSLLQICGRAARNVRGRVIMYADKVTKSMQKTIDVTTARRIKQDAYNKEHGIEPKNAFRKKELIEMAFEDIPVQVTQEEVPSIEAIRKSIQEWEEAMKRAAKEHRFDDAATARDVMRRLQQLEVEYGP